MSTMLEQLHRAILDGRVRELPGFGAGLESRLLQALQTRQGAATAPQVALAESYVEPLIALSQGRTRG